MEEVERITCADEHGARYTVIVRQRIRHHRPLDGPVQKVKGALDLILADGRDVNALDDELNTFQILDTGEILTRI